MPLQYDEIDEVLKLIHNELEKALPKKAGVLYEPKAVTPPEPKVVTPPEPSHSKK